MTSGYGIMCATLCVGASRPATVSNLNKKIYATIEGWRDRAIEGAHPYVYPDGIALKRTWAAEVWNVSPLVATGVNGDGYREILGIVQGAKEDKASWLSFLKHLKDRGLGGVRLIIRMRAWGLVVPDARGQRCVVHSTRTRARERPRRRQNACAPGSRT
jgi:putative transposase